MARDRDEFTDEPPRPARGRDDYPDEPRRSRRDRDYDDYADDDYDRDRRSIANVPNYLVPSILVTLCCCVPGGVVAIVHAAQVNGKLASGDCRGAINASQTAKMWCWISFGVGFVLNIIFAAIQIAAEVAKDKLH
jgi:hypothetical protein